MSEPSFVLGPRDGFAPAIGNLVSQLEVARHYLLRATRDLTPKQLDARPAGAVNPIGAVLRHLVAAEAREATLAGMRARDDAWLARPMTFFGRPSNVLYYWTHYLLDEARHTGQIIVARKHGLPDADPAFAPYV